MDVVLNWFSANVNWVFGSAGLVGSLIAIITLFKVKKTKNDNNSNMVNKSGVTVGNGNAGKVNIKNYTNKNGVLIAGKNTGNVNVEINQTEKETPAENKIIFTEGFIIGNMGAKIMHRRVDVGEIIEMPADLKKGLTSVLFDIGFLNANQWVDQLSQIMKTANDNSGSENTIQQFKLFDDLRNKIDTFIIEKYNESGSDTFRAGCAIAFIRRLFMFFDDIDQVVDNPALHGRINIEQAQQTIYQFCRPHIEGILWLSKKEHFPKSLRRSLNVIATEEILNNRGRTRIREELSDIGVEFGLSIYHNPKKTNYPT